METPTEVTETKVETGKTVFGVNQINNPTPIWATWVFRIYFYLASFFTFMLSINKHISPEAALEIIEYISISTVGVHGLSKMIGIDTTKQEEEAKSAFK